MAAVDDLSKIIMNTQAHAYPVRTRESDELLVISATTYLLLGVAFGPHFVLALVLTTGVVAAGLIGGPCGRAAAAGKR
jgi:hypothetical protein